MPLRAKQTGFMTNTVPLIIVATHGDLACVLLQASESIAGVQQDMACVGLQAGADLQEFQSHILGTFRPGQPTLILVDIPGGTPWHVAATIAARLQNVRVVSGVNLSMLLEVALSRRGLDIDELAELARQTGIEAITISRFEGGK